MNSETTSETTEQQISTVEEDSPKQPEPDLNDIEFPDDDPIEPTPSSSKNVLTNGLKRPLPDGVDGEKIKTFRLTEVIQNCNTNNSKKVDEHSNGVDQEFEVRDSENSCDISSSDSIVGDFNSVILGNNLFKKSFSQLLQCNELTYDQYDNFITQKLMAMIIHSKLFRDRIEIHATKRKLNYWKSKFILLYEQIKKLKTVVNIQNQRFKINRYNRPYITTKNVGLQSGSCSREEGSVELPKQAIPSPKPDPVYITVEDDDDVTLEFATVESASSSTSKITNTTTKKQMLSLVTTPKTLVVSPKNVTAAKSLNHINIGTTITTIDLTGNDDVKEESNTIDLEDSISPIEIRRRIAASLLPAGTLVSGNSRKTITSLELSKNPSTSSSRLRTKTASHSSHGTIVLNEDTINTRPKSKNLKSILKEASYTPSKITLPQLSALLKTLTPSYTTCQKPESLGTSDTTCRLPKSSLAIHHTGSQPTRKPPPPDIQLLRHPSPVPGIPNQKSLPIWKCLPPAPNILNIKKSPAGENTRHVISLSWTMNVEKIFAEIKGYQLYAYKENPDEPPNVELWKKVGEVKALPLPMTCLLSHFSNDHKYHFLIRAVDVHTRVGPFSKPESLE